MKTRLFIIQFFFISILSNTQGVIIPTWSVIDSSSQGFSEAWGIDVDEDENIYWAVSSDDLNQGLDIYCHKFQIGGEIIWDTPLIYGGVGTQHAYVCNANDTWVYIGGKNCTGFATTCDMLLLKIDKDSGSLMWDKTNNFTANGYDEVDGLEVNADGIYCGGWSQELNPSIYRSDIGLWKLDHDGNTVWSNYLGSNATAEHQDGHFVVDSIAIYAAGLWGGTGIGNLYNGHSFLGKFSNADGSLIDSTLFGHQSDAINDIENALGMATDGTFLYITGYSTPLSVDDWQIFVAKYDKNLNQIWYTDWGGEGTESARGIQVKNDIIYVAGLTESESLMKGGNRDAVLLTIDTDGNVLSYQTFGNSDKQSFQDIAVSNQNIYLTGTIENAKKDKKAMLLALEDYFNSTEVNTFTPTNTFTLYPNPSNGEIKIEFQQGNHENGKIKIFDILGKCVFHRNFNGTDDIIPLTLNQNGEYFIQVEFPKYKVTKKVINWEY